MIRVVYSSNPGVFRVFRAKTRSVIHVSYNSPDTPMSNTQKGVATIARLCTRVKRFSPLCEWRSSFEAFGQFRPAGHFDLQFSGKFLLLRKELVNLPRIAR